MKILFLDIDGVLLPGRAYYLPWQSKGIVKEFDPCAVSLVNALLKDMDDLEMVIHSSWLRFWKNNVEGMTVKDWMIYQGIRSDRFHVDDSCDGELHWRYDRIDKWLAEHPEVSPTDFVIIDDEPANDDWEHKSRLILTDFDNGVEPKTIIKALELLQ